MNANSFSVALGYNSNTKIQRLINTDNKPSFELLLDISNKFSTISIEWLITGNGEMIKTDVSPKDLEQCQEQNKKLVDSLLKKDLEIESLKIVHQNEHSLNLNETATKYKKTT